MIPWLSQNKAYLTLSYFFFPACFGLLALDARAGLTAAAESASVFPGLNLTTFLAGIVMDFPVAGLRPSRPARSVIEKVPNPTN